MILATRQRSNCLPSVLLLPADQLIGLVLEAVRFCAYMTSLELSFALENEITRLTEPPISSEAESFSEINKFPVIYGNGN